MLVFFRIWGLLLIAMLICANPSYADQGEGGPKSPDNEAEGLVLKTVIKGNIYPKSIGHSGNGRFFAQNAHYGHSITVYDRNYRLLATISDKFKFDDYEIYGYRGNYQGSPAEITFSPDGRYAWVSNTQVTGWGFANPGNDRCATGNQYDNSYLFKVNTQTLQIESLVEVGAVPKYLTASPDGRRVLVSNWCSGDVSIVDSDIETEVGRIPVGNNPHGIAVDSKSRYAYVAVSGDNRIAIIRISDYSVSFIKNVGLNPRSLCLGTSDRYLYASLSKEGAVAKIDLLDGQIVGKVKTGAEARSMSLSPDGRFLYVVNYDDNMLSKVRTTDMEIMDEVRTNEHPIGVTFDSQTRTVWVSCYSGTIMVFEDQNYLSQSAPPLVSSHQPPRQRNTIVPGPLRPASPNSHNAHQQNFQQNAADQPNMYVLRNEPSSGTSIAVADSRPNYRRPADQPATFSSAPTASHPTTASRSVGASTARYHVIVASFTTRQTAEIKVRQLRAAGYEPRIIEGGGRFRVSSHSFAHKDQAQAANRQVRKLLGVDAWVLKQ